MNNILLLLSVKSKKYLLYSERAGINGRTFTYQGFFQDEANAIYLDLKEGEE